MKIVTKTGPQSEPISLQEAKDHLKLTHAFEDAYVNLLIKVAREKFEKDTGRVLVESTFEMYLDYLRYDKEFSADIVIFKCPVIEVLEIATKVDCVTEVFTVVNPSTYKVDVYNEPARILFSVIPVYGAQVDNIYIDQMNSIRVTFKAGYASNNIPEQAKHAMKLLIGHLYENRQTVVTGTQVNDVPMTYQYLIEQFKYSI